VAMCLHNVLIQHIMSKMTELEDLKGSKRPRQRYYIQQKQCKKLKDIDLKYIDYQYPLKFC
jgi:hypothetical protein